MKMMEQTGDLHDQVSNQTAVIHHGQPETTFALPDTVESNDYSASPPTMMNVLGH